MKRKKLNKNGNCYEVAARFGALNPPDDKEYTVVHGIVGGMIMEGEYVALHGHAWVEYCEHVQIPKAMKAHIPEGHPDYFEVWFCIDKANDHDITMPREVYYCFGGVREDETIRYTVDELRVKMLDTETYGPWDELIFETEKKELVV